MGRAGAGWRGLWLGRARGAVRWSWGQLFWMGRSAARVERAIGIGSGMGWGGVFNAQGQGWPWQERGPAVAGQGRGSVEG